MTAPRTFRIRAHAKINLTLRVGAVQADGYHPLQTVFQSLALHDTLEVTPRQGPFTLTCSDPGVPGRRTQPRRRAPRARCGPPSAGQGSPDGVAIHLSKQIPMQAGLGGGSSDAASALSALARRLAAAGRTSGPCDTGAAGLGSDVPYFLARRDGAGTFAGRGTLSARRPAGPFAVVLALPAFGVATADAYRWFDEDGPQPAAGIARRPPVPSRRGAAARWRS